MRSLKMKNPSKEWVCCLPETPLGPLWFSFTEQGLTALEFAGDGSVSMLSDDTLPAASQAAGPSRPAGVILLFCRPPHRFRRPHPGPPGHAFPTPGVAGTAPDPLGPDHLLRRTGPPGGQPQGLPGRGPGQRGQPHPPHHPLPPGHRGRRQPGRLQFRPGPQALAAPPRRGEVRAVFRFRFSVFRFCYHTDNMDTSSLRSQVPPGLKNDNRKPPHGLQLRQGL